MIIYDTCDKIRISKVEFIDYIWILKPSNKLKKLEKFRFIRVEKNAEIIQFYVNLCKPQNLLVQVNFNSFF